MFKNYMLALLVFNLSACATVYSVPPPSPGTVPSGLRLDDRVEVITLDGDKHKFVITKIDSTGIGGSAEFFAYTEIKSISLRQASSPSPSTVAKVAGLVALAITVSRAAGGAKDAGRAVGCVFSQTCPR